jgi:hypothetical protein
LCNPGVTGERRWADTGAVRFTGTAGSNSFVIILVGVYYSAQILLLRAEVTRIYASIGF